MPIHLTTEVRSVLGNFIKKTIALNKASLGKMIEFFDNHNMAYVPSHTNFIFVNINMSSRVAYEELLKLGVIIRPGFLWGLENYIRVSSGSLEETDVFLKALAKVIK